MECVLICDEGAFPKFKRHQRQSWRFWYTIAQENCRSTTQKERVLKSVNSNACIIAQEAQYEVVLQQFSCAMVYQNLQD